MYMVGCGTTPYLCLCVVLLCMANVPFFFRPPISFRMWSLAQRPTVQPAFSHDLSISAVTPAVTCVTSAMPRIVFGFSHATCVGAWGFTQSPKLAAEIWILVRFTVGGFRP